MWPPAHPGPGLSEPQGDLPSLAVLPGTDPLVGGGHQVPGLAVVLIPWPCVSVPGREAFMLPTISNGCCVCLPPTASPGPQCRDGPLASGVWALGVTLSTHPSSGNEWGPRALSGLATCPVSCLG